MTEDLCFDDLDGYPGHGAYRSESSLWPPSYECELLGNDVEPVVVQHQTAAIARFGATVVIPVVYVLSLTLVVVYMGRRRFPGQPEPAER